MESVMRAPCFVFEDMQQGALFLVWAVQQYDTLQAIVRTTSPELVS